MEKTFLDLSDNLYYADQIGSVEDQIEWLDSLHISEPFLYKDMDSMGETLAFIAHPYKDDPLCSKMFVLKPHYSEHPTTFNGDKSLDIRRYLSDRFDPVYQLLTFKPKPKCVEDHSEAAVDTAVAEDVASLYPTEVSECGN